MGSTVTIGDHFFDPENERIVEFLGAIDVMGLEFRFRDIETGEFFDIFECEVREEWPHMNAMEVLAWAAKD